MEKLSQIDKAFINESNRIENINLPYTKGQEKAFIKFMSLDHITIDNLKDFVKAYQPNAKLRVGQSKATTVVGTHIAPYDGPGIGYALSEILDDLENFTPYQNHVMYERLHPFTDCNGRSGRALWLWQMRNTLSLNPTIGFLQTFYYQSLDGAS